MQFIDRAKISVKAGDGGKGKSAFRREKFIPKGGPSGGDGGRGADIVFVVDRNMNTLLDFRYHRKFKGKDGGNGDIKNMTGANAEPCFIKVPPGTLVKDAATGAVLADLTEVGQTIINYLIDDSDWGPEDASALPLNLLKRAGYFVLQVGTILERDQIPALKQAFYVQARHELTPNLGVAAWYLRSVGNDSHRFLAANGTTNDVSTFDTLANVVGVGAKWQLSKNAALSFDYGVNTTDFGKYMNGHTRYEHTRGTSDFAIKGRETGFAPRFWVMRLDLGKADTKVPHSWNAFIDYKRFEHGSFFGGNGTEALPDRYLDGIKSFTVGAGYVPMENLLVEAFYTFGAKGIGPRDTLYGSENFKLGDYARVQLTYRF